MVHQRVPVTVQEKLKKAILTFDERPEGKLFLKEFKRVFSQIFCGSKNYDYDVIRNF